jgi:hypothetical protein
VHFLRIDRPKMEPSKQIKQMGLIIDDNPPLLGEFGG